MTGRFYLGFEFQTARGHRSEGTAKALRTTWQSVVLCLYILLFFFGRVVDPATSFWKSFAALFAIYWIGYPLIYFYGKVMGYFEESPVAVCEVQLPGLGTLPFGTWHPARLRAAVDRPEIRDSLTRLLDSCHADSLEAPTDARFGGGYRNWPFSVGTAWFGRDKLLNKEVVGKTLTELSTLCADLEQAFPEAMRI